MDDSAAKANLHTYLRHERAAVLAKLDGLSEYDARRPLTATGTNLLGLVKHVARSSTALPRNRCPGGRTPTAAISGRPRTRPAIRSSGSTGARGNTRTRRSTSFPSTP